MKKISILLLSMFIFIGGIVWPQNAEASSGAYKVAIYKYKGQPYVQVTNHPNKNVASKINKTLKTHAVTAATAAKDSEILKNKGWYKTAVKTVYNKNGKLSVIYTTSAFYGGAHDRQWSTTYNFDTTTGKRVLLKDVLNTRAKILNATQYTRYILEVKNSKSDDIYDTEAIIDMSKGSFYFRDNGITLIFDPYEVAAFYLGTIEVIVPQTIISGAEKVPTFSKEPLKNTEPEASRFLKSSLVSIYSNDGKTFLGTLSTNKYDPDSIFNKYGSYGSDYGTNSIWNEYGDYGSEYSSNSAFNEYASTPPLLMIGDEIVGYVTINQYFDDALSPYILYELAIDVDKIKD